MAEAVKKKKAEQYEYQAELKQLLNLIIHSLYTHPEVFLRELISNASDALNHIRFRMLTDKDVLDPEAPLQSRIGVDPDKKFFSIEDTGIGMTKDDLINRIGTVASSGTLEFLQQLQKQKDAKIDANLIGQFGVGFYSVFMVADEVTIETRHADKNSQGYRWKSDGRGTFTIEEIDKPNRGTKIFFKLKKEAEEYSQEFRVNEIIRKYSNFVDFPILVNGKEVNRVQALWHKSKSEINEEELNEFYKFITNDTENPLGHLHLSIEGAVNFKALLFIPASAPPFLRPDEEKSVQLYSRKIFIQDDCKELIPEYLRFIKGVVDTDDLPLNVSREVTQSSPAMAKIRDTLVKKILGYLEDLAKSEPAKYQQFYKNYGQMFALGINIDFTNRDRIIELLRFESTHTDKGSFTSLKDYVSRMGSDQKEIYYISGDSREALEKNPNLEYFKKNEIEVLLLTNPVDIFILPAIGEYDKKPIKSIEKADIETQKDKEHREEALSDNLADSLIKVFKETLGDKVEDVIVSRRLVDSPVTLVVGKEGLDPQMEKMMKILDKDFKGSKKILEINTSHPLIKNLSRLNMGNSTDPLLRQCILQLYEGALLLDGNLSSPTEFVKRMTEIMTEATKA
ncbi:MAG: molecular chaperone HtpG [Calditrichaeota bacterium]|nr:MAG: molecular chaperone HtpG [Calditrichota bacterium]